MIKEAEEQKKIEEAKKKKLKNEKIARQLYKNQKSRDNSRLLNKNYKKLR